MHSLGELTGSMRGLEKGVERIDGHLATLNGQVKENTKFRNKALGALVVISFIASTNLIAFIISWLKIVN